MSWTEEFLLTWITAALWVYACMATGHFWRHRPAIGWDANYGRYRSVRLMYRERAR
jgi:hypothetical protein